MYEHDYHVALLRKIAGLGPVAKNLGDAIGSISRGIRGAGAKVFREGVNMSKKPGMLNSIGSKVLTMGGKGIGGAGKFIAKNPGAAAGIAGGVAAGGLAGAGYLAGRAGREDY